MTQKYYKRENGFGLLAIVIGLMIVGIIGATGFLVYQRNSVHVPMPASSNNDNKSTNTPAESNVSYSGNTAVYTSKNGGFTLTFPKTWAVRSVGCADGLILLGADANSVGSCGSEGFGQMTFAWGPLRTGCGVTPAYYTDITTQSIVASGVSGTKTTATASAGAGDPIGTKIEQYCYIKDGIMYAASYTQNSNYLDVLPEFESMMTDGLFFK